MFSQFKLVLYALVGYLIYDMLIRKKNVHDDFTDYINVGKNVSYPEYRFKEFADVLFYAMDTFEGTDEEAIIGIVKKLKTSSDVRKLKEVFGNPEYTGNPFAFGLGAWTNPPTSLSGWLSNEGMLQRANSQLASQGITERF